MINSQVVNTPEITVVTANMGGILGVYPALVEILAAESPDIIALQGVAIVNGEIPGPELLASALGSEYNIHRFDQMYPGEPLGAAFISRIPLIGRTGLDTLTGHTLVDIAQFETIDSGPVQVSNLHLPAKPQEFRQRLRKITSLLRYLDKSSIADLSLICGDFNCLRLSATMRKLREHSYNSAYETVHGKEDNAITYPSKIGEKHILDKGEGAILRFALRTLSKVGSYRRPEGNGVGGYEIDRLMHDARLRPVNTRVIGDGISEASFSDHCGVLGRFAFS